MTGFRLPLRPPHSAAQTVVGDGCRWRDGGADENLSRLIENISNMFQTRFPVKAGPEDLPEDKKDERGTCYTISSRIDIIAAQGGHRSLPDRTGQSKRTPAVARLHARRRGMRSPATGPVNLLEATFCSRASKHKSSASTYDSRVDWASRRVPGRGEERNTKQAASKHFQKQNTKKRWARVWPRLAHCDPCTT